jgi:hypothetical protein
MQSIITSENEKNQDRIYIIEPFSKSKDVPILAKQTASGRRGTAPTHSLPLQ